VLLIYSERDYMDDKWKEFLQHKKYENGNIKILSPIYF